MELKCRDSDSLSSCFSPLNHPAAVVFNARGPGFLKLFRRTYTNHSMQKMACLNENSVPSTLHGGRRKTWERTWECRHHRVQNNDHGTWAAKTMLVMLKCRTGSLRAEMGGQEHAYIKREGTSFP